MAANPERGELTLELAGKKYRLRPSHEAAVAIEEETGMSLFQLYTLCNTLSIPLKALGIVAAEYIRAGAEDDLTSNVSADRIAELIYEDGIPMPTAVIAKALAEAISGGRTASGEAKAARPAPRTKGRAAGAA